jgi:hypothetical protein
MIGENRTHFLKKAGTEIFSHRPTDKNDQRNIYFFLTNVHTSKILRAQPARSGLVQRFTASPVV